MQRSGPPRRRTPFAAVALLIPTALLAAPLAMAAPSPTAAPADQRLVLERGPDEVAKVVVVEVDGTAELDRLVATGVDLDHGVEQHGEHLEVRAVVTDSEIATLREAGYEIGDTLYTSEDTERALADRKAYLAQARTATRRLQDGKDSPGLQSEGGTHPDVSDIKILRADYYTTFGQGILSVEARWAGGPTQSTPLTVERDSGPGTPLGSGGTQTIARFVDAGVYLYHRGATAVLVDDRGGAGSLPVRPDRIRITSPSGDVAIVKVRDWLPTGSEKDPFKGAGYQEDFIGTFLAPGELYQRIRQLAQQYPDLSELVELPHETNGYRRKAMGLLEPSNRVEMTIGSATVNVAYANASGASLSPNNPTSPTVVLPVRIAANGGCSAVGNLTGTIAIVERSTTCTLGDQVLAVQAAGASAVLVAGAAHALPAAPNGTIPGVTVPVLGISRADLAKVRNGGAVTGRIVPGTTPGASSRVGIETRAWGHEGGNAVTAEIAVPEADSTLSVSVTGNHVSVTPAADSTGAVTSTAAEVVAAIDAHAGASALVDAYLYRSADNQTGQGVVVPSGTVRLSDGLSAPLSVSRDPHKVYAIKIGKTRDGSKPGVLAYGQEHAREWVPPLVTLEVAERLLRNYETHAPTRDLVDNLEIWVAPSINPDGGHYSFYDFASQRRNMTRYCAEGTPNDYNARNAWGVDVNRNYDEYSTFDGYSGATPSTVNCTSDTNAGPAELSEPEAQNVDWMMSHANMKFSMNMHSSGNYFMWAPGAYKTQGREASPRPSVKDEAFFWQASERILTGIKRHRGLSVTPARTGPIIDVLYSAAGNSGDMAWYKYGIYGWSFEVGSTFQPPFRTTPDAPNAANAHDEVMEYGNGLMELVRVARDLDLDVSAPETMVEVTETANDPTKVNVRFLPNEPSDLRFTVDGTRPDATSRLIQPAAVREGGETVVVDKGATLYFYATDSAGNVENGYDPADAGDQRYRKWKAVPGWEPSTSQPDVSLSLAARSVKVGETTTATVKVEALNEFGLAPSGTVTLTAGGAVIGEVELRSGSGTATVGPFPAAGRLTVGATYGGDDLTAGGTSAAVALEVVAPATPTPPPVPGEVSSTVKVVRVAPKKVRVGARAKVVVKVRAPGVKPTGRVRITVGKKVVGWGKVDAKGRVTIRLKKFGKAGKRTLVVTYLGGKGVTGSSTTVVLRVVRR